MTCCADQSLRDPTAFARELEVAVAGGDTDAALAALRAGAEVDTLICGGLTLLAAAAALGHLGLVREFIALGADVGRCSASSALVVQCGAQSMLTTTL